MYIEFVGNGEQGQDWGGLTAEWFSLLAAAMTNEDLGHFIPQGEPIFSRFAPGANSSDDIAHYKLYGHLIGKALTSGYQMDVRFPSYVYKMMLGLEVEWEDMKSLDPEILNGLKYYMEHPDEIEEETTFAIDVDAGNGTTRSVELVPGGANMSVNASNIEDYVKAYSHYTMVTAVEQQLTAFIEAFHEVAYVASIKTLLSVDELQLAIAGEDTIDVQDLKNHTQYLHYQASAPQILWFWEVFEEYDLKHQQMVVQFVTGSHRAPPGGFAQLKNNRGQSQPFKIVRTPRVDHLPNAHTCFNQLDLPAYSTKEYLQGNLTTAIENGCSGFASPPR